jgi:hypothetical protein
MLSEELSDPLPDSDLLPPDLLPKTYFSEDSIKRSLAKNKLILPKNALLAT